MNMKQNIAILLAQGGQGQNENKRDLSTAGKGNLK